MPPCAGAQHLTREQERLEETGADPAASHARPAPAGADWNGKRRGSHERMRGMFAARTDCGSFVILEVLETEHPELGDVVSHGDFWSLGTETYLNFTRRMPFNVCVQNVVATNEQAKEQCFLSARLTPPRRRSQGG